MKTYDFETIYATVAKHKSHFSKLNVSYSKVQLARSMTIEFFFSNRINMLMKLLLVLGANL